ncbi:6-bladed beta-propeller [Rhodohalobacter mucosus]|nr:6-bladed beta-propeller [Rhodohalobacter mucosus]
MQFSLIHGSLPTKGRGLYLALILLVLSAGCSPENSSDQNLPEITVLDRFTKAISVDDNLLYAPVSIQIDAEGNLYVLDTAVMQVQVLDAGEPRLIRSIAGPGRGPGEIVRPSHIRLANNMIHVIDTGQFVIQRYSLDGRFHSAISYGEWGYFPSVAAPPPAPVNPSAVITPDLDNKPHILANGDLMLSPMGVRDSISSLYRRYNSDREFLARIGHIPDGSSFILSNEEVKSDIQENRIPSFYLPKAFPVSSAQDEDLIYMIFSSMPKIARYQSDGIMAWEKEITGISELDSIKTGFFSSMERIMQNDSRFRITLNFYHSGTVSPEGELWLITQYRDIYLHRFSANGALLNRYKLVAEDEKLKPIFDIHFERKEIFIVNSDGEVLLFPY